MKFDYYLHVGEPLSAEITWKVPDAQMDGYSVPVEIKLSLKPFSAVGTRPLRQLSVHHADMQVCNQSVSQFNNQR